MDLFSHLDHTERERDERQSGSRAMIAAKARSRQQFGRYIGNAGSDGERAARIGMLEGEIREVVAGVCEQYEHENVEGVMEIVLSHLKTACSECGCDCSDGDCKCGDCSTCNKKQAAAHPDGCGCSFPVCVKKREGANPDSEAGEKEDKPDSEPDSDEDDSKPFWESSVHEAAPAVVDKDNSQQETVDLPSADESGLGGPSPKIDKGTWKGLDPIDVGSQVHRLENQDPTDRPDYQEGPYADAKGSGGYEGAGIPDQPNLTQVDAQKVMQSPAHGDHTDVFPDGKHQADPVTSSWRILDQ